MKLISKAWNRARDVVEQRRYVGADRVGNRYYLAADTRGAYSRRLVDYKTEVDPLALHPLWRVWLNHKRPKPPSEKEIDLFEEEQRQLKMRVKMIEQADAKLRLEEMAQRQREGRDFYENYSAASFIDSIRRGVQKDQPAAPLVEEHDTTKRVVNTNAPALDQPSAVVEDPTYTRPSAASTKARESARSAAQSATSGPNAPSETWNTKKAGNDDSAL